MLITLKYKTKNGKCYKCNKKITVKEAVKYFKENFEKDDNIIKVWLAHFGELHEYCYKRLKGGK